MVLLVNCTLLRCTRVEPCCQTYTIDKQVPDSAGTATAFLTGVKTRDGTIGVNRHAQRSNCSSEAGNAVTSILDWSKAEGASKQSTHTCILVVCTCNLEIQKCEQILDQNVLIVMMIGRSVGHLPSGCVQYNQRQSLFYPLWYNHTN